MTPTPLLNYYATGDLIFRWSNRDRRAECFARTMPDQWRVSGLISEFEIRESAGAAPVSYMEAARLERAWRCGNGTRGPGAQAQAAPQRPAQGQRAAPRDRRLGSDPGGAGLHGERAGPARDARGQGTRGRREAAGADAERSGVMAENPMTPPPNLDLLKGPYSLSPFGDIIMGPKYGFALVNAHAILDELNTLANSRWQLWQALQDIQNIATALDSDDNIDSKRSAMMALHKVAQVARVACATEAASLTPLESPTAKAMDFGSVEDGFGSSWPRCGAKCSLHVLRPGKSDCNEDGPNCPSKEPQ